MNRLSFLLFVLCACSGSTSVDDLDGALPTEDGGVASADGGDTPSDAEVPADSQTPPQDAGSDDASVVADAGVDSGALDAGTSDSGVDAGPVMPACVRGVEFMDRCVYLVRSRSDERDPCPVGARRARWGSRAEQVALQDVIGMLEVTSAATSLRRVNGVGPWTWEDRSPAPADLIWASPPGTVFPNAYLTPTGLAPYHREWSWTLCEAPR